LSKGHNCITMRNIIQKSSTDNEMGQNRARMKNENKNDNFTLKLSFLF